MRTRLAHPERWWRARHGSTAARRLLAAASLLLAAGWVGTPAPLVADTHHDQVAIVLAGSGVPEFGELVSRETRAAALMLPARIGASLPDTVYVALCGTAAEFRRYTAGMEIHGLLGVAHPQRALLALHVALLMPGPERSLVGTLRHELVHLALGATAARAGVRLPRWFDEGVASWIGGRYTDTGPIAAANLTRAPWLHLAALDVSFPEQRDRRQLAYAKSLAAVERLEELQPGAVAAVTRTISAGHDFHTALAVTGMTVDELDQETRRHTRWRWLVQAVPRAIASPWVLLALLTVVAFVVRRVRLRRRPVDDDR